MENNNQNLENLSSTQTPNILKQQAQKPLNQNINISNPKETPETYIEKTQRLKSKYNNSIKKIEYTGPEYSKMQTYGQRATFDRLYGSNAFKDLGFNPYEDMNKYYDDNTSYFNDLGRSTTSFMKLAALPFKEVTGAYTAQQEAFNYGKYAELGSSTRGGTFGFVNDLYVNSGYTVGLMTEIALEEIGLGVLTGLTGGVAGEALLARTGANIGRGVKKALTGAEKAKKLQKIEKGLADLDKVQEASSFYTKAKKGAISLGKTFNPLEGVTNIVKGVKGGAFDGLTGMAKLSTSFGEFYRDYRELRLVHSESRLESGFAYNDTYDQLYNEYKEKTGKEPTVQQMANFVDKAKKAATGTYIANLGLIYVTNKITFNPLFRKYSPKFLKNTDVSTAHGTITANKTLKGEAFSFKKANKTTRDYIKSGYNKSKSLFKRNTWTFPTLKKNIYSGFKSSLKYTKSNFSEGIQEVGQEIIQDANINNVKDEYNLNIEGGLFDNYLSSFKKYATSTEGLSIFGSGFLMGGLVKPFSHVQSRIMDKSTNYYQKKKNKEEYLKKQIREKEQEKYIKEQVDNLNKIVKDPISYFGIKKDNLLKQVNLSHASNEAEKDGKEKLFRDIKDKQQALSLLQAVDSGHYNQLIDTLKKYKNLSDDDLHKAFAQKYSKDDISSFRKNLDQTIERAKKFKQVHDYINDEFNENPFEEYKKPKHNIPDDDIYMQNQIKYLAWEKAKQDIILKQFSLMRTKERQQGLYDKIAKSNSLDLKNVTSRDLELLINKEELDKEISFLSSEIETLKSRPEKEQSIKDEIKNKTKRLESLQAIRLGNSLKSQITEAIEKNSKLEDNDLIGSHIRSKSGALHTISKLEKTKGGVKYYRTTKGRIIKETTIDKVLKTHKDKVKESLESNLNELLDEIYGSYSDYFESIGLSKKDLRSDKKSRELFKDIIDHYLLEKDHEDLQKEISILTDPQGYEDNFKRHNKALYNYWLNREEDLKKALKVFLEKQDDNEILKVLKNKYGIFLDEEGLIKLFDEKQMPEDFFDIQSLKPIRQDSPKFNEIKSELEKYLGVDEEKVKEEKKPKEPEKKDIEKPEIINNEGVKNIIEKTTLDTPIEKWDKKLLKIVKEEFEKHNKRIDLNDNIEPSMKEKLKFKTIEDFIKSNSQKLKITGIINRFYKETKKPEKSKKVKESKKPEEQKKPTNLEESKKTKEPEKTKKPFIPEGILKDLEETGVIDLELSDDEIKEIRNENITNLVLSSSSALAKKVTRELIKQKILKPGQTIDNLPMDRIFNIKFKDSKGNDTTIIVGYMFKGKPSDLDGVMKSLAKIGYSETKTSLYQTKITLGDKTYYVKNDTIKQWLEGNGKLHIFQILELPEENDINLEEEYNKWFTDLNKSLLNFKNFKKLNSYFEEVIKENMNRKKLGLKYISEEDLTNLYEKAKKNIPNNVNTNDYTVNTAYYMTGNLKDKGPSIVKKVTKTEIIMLSSKTKEEFSVPLDQIAFTIGDMITDINEDIASMGIEKVEIDKDIQEETKLHSKEISEDNEEYLDILNAQIKKESSEEIEKAFFESLGCDK